MSKSNQQYNTLNIKTLKGNLLINIRDRYIEQSVKKLINKNIIPPEFLNELSNIEIAIGHYKIKQMENLLYLQQTSSMPKNIQPEINNIDNSQTTEITNDQKYNIIKNKIMKECLKNTAKLIVELSLN